MSVATVKEIVCHRSMDYRKAGKLEKARLLDELVQLTGYHRKSLVRILSAKEPQPAEKTDRRRGSRYAMVRPLLYQIWDASFFSCGKRLQPFLPELMAVMLRTGELHATSYEQELLLSMSAATIDRQLVQYRRQYSQHGRSLTKPGTLLRDQIPIRTFADWDEQKPGFFEIDLVAHCGG
ncbi:MAG TPA: hypothetical protein VHR86_09575, partial [Armatimonadota bacterium]|nr:hypothetical protein [Armatimonadota bacterium]